MEKELPPVDDAETKSTASLPPHVAAAVRWHNHEVRAVLYYHRMLIHEAMNQPTAAAADLQRIQALGRTASEHLF
jgi:hypothetical protein